jgi:membrane fusion protein, multidrug efflux system
MHARGYAVRNRLIFMILSRRRSQPFACAIAAAWLVFGLSACSEKSAGGAGGGGRRGGPGGAAPVIVAQAVRKVVPQTIDAIGTVEPIRSASVRAQITGTLFKIDIHEGQDVAEGAVLFEIDPRPYENALKSAIAEQQRIAVQLQNARDQVSRYSNLNVGAMVSQEQIDGVKATAQTLEAQAASTDAALATAKLNLGYCSVRAPLSGRTGNLNVHEGDMIRLNDTTVLVTVNQLSPIYVTFGIAQQHLGSLNRYRAAGTLKVDVSPGTGEDHVADGELTFVDNTVDPTTGAIKLKATFPNTDHHLWPGQFATVTVTLAAPEVLTVPASAIQSDQAGQHVYIIKDDQTAEFRPIVVERTADDVAVVSKGLKEGETVVIDGQLRVIPGEAVQIKPPEVLTNPEAAASAPAPGGKKGKGKGKKQDS